MLVLPPSSLITTISEEGHLSWSEVACPATRFSTLDLSKLHHHNFQSEGRQIRGFITTIGEGHH